MGDFARKADGRRVFTADFERGGRGLGLTVIEEILAQHRFEFGLKNRPEEGAVFRMRC